jgi:hypothetical protein
MERRSHDKSEGREIPRCPQKSFVKVKTKADSSKVEKVANSNVE